MLKPIISFVSPVYKCRDCLEKLVLEIRKACETIDVDFEIILVNDKCPEDSWEAIKELTKSTPEVTGINLSRNYGQHSAIEAGLSIVRGQWVVVLDCDLQDHPSALPAMWEKAMEGAEVVLVKRDARTDSWLRRAFSKTYYAVLSYLTGQKIDADIANFGLYQEKVIAAYNSWSEEQKYFPVMIQWLGFKQTTISVKHNERHAGKSSYNLKTLLKLGTNVVLSFSDRPLWIMSMIGGLIAALSFFFGGIYLIWALLGGSDVQGWPSIVISIWFLGGANIAAAGLIGIYLGRVLREAKERPSFVISEIASHQTGK
ncbi:glycosyltransferase family 2 protein [Hyphococcus lacteus]|uniref:Glycosyltransferase family 2 protein n=1 Tax=Hyphococcus lacteus TaxID=3143536 RepID=A0ABV3Z2F4_9PROT